MHVRLGNIIYLSIRSVGHQRNKQTNIDEWIGTDRVL